MGKLVYFESNIDGRSYLEELKFVSYQLDVKGYRIVINGKETKRLIPQEQSEEPRGTYDAFVWALKNAFKCNDVVDLEDVAEDMYVDE